MCLCPITIPNPYFSQSPSAVQRGEVFSSFEAARFCRLKSPSIQVPCGHCEECRRRRVNDLTVRAYIESLTSYVYNIMLSYDSDHLPVSDFSVVDDNGELRPLRLAYAPKEHIQNLFKRMRNLPEFKDRGFRYVATSEFGGQRHRPHWHVLLFVARKNTDPSDFPYRFQSFLRENILRYYSINRGSLRAPVYEPLLTPSSKFFKGKEYTNYLVKFVETRTSQDVDSAPISNYIGYLSKYVYKDDRYVSDVYDKYLSKLDLDHFSDLYKAIFDILRPKFLISKGFGLGFYPSDGSLVYCSFLNGFMTTQLKTVRQKSSYVDLANFIDSRDPSYIERIKSDVLRDVQISASFDVYARAHYTVYDYRVACFLLATDRSLRRSIYNVKPDFPFPPRISISSYRAFFDVSIRESTARCLEHSVVASVIRSAIENSISNVQSNFFSISLVLPKKTLTFALPAFYKRRFLTLSDYEKFLNLRKINSFDDLPIFSRSPLRLSSDEIRSDGLRRYADLSVENSRQANPFSSLSFDAYDVLYCDSTLSVYCKDFIAREASSLAKTRMIDRL
uniref:Replication initiator protein n=2 Tax=Dulem virus 269 TaxID=3145746 RepID=A0AAU8B8T5_9VIRU